MMPGGQIEKIMIYLPQFIIFAGVVGILIINLWKKSNNLISRIVFMASAAAAFSFLLFIFLVMFKDESSIAGFTANRGLVGGALLVISFFFIVGIPAVKKNFYHIVLLISFIAFYSGLFADNILHFVLSFVVLDVALLFCMGKITTNGEVLIKEGMHKRIFYILLLLPLSVAASGFEPLMNVKAYKVCVSFIVAFMFLMSFVSNLVMGETEVGKSNIRAFHALAIGGGAAELLVLSKMLHINASYLIYPALAFIFAALLIFAALKTISEERYHMFVFYRFAAVFFIVPFIFIGTTSGAGTAGLIVIAVLAAVTMGAIFTTNSGKESVTVNMIKFHPNATKGVLLAAVSEILMLAAEIIIIYVLISTIKPDPVLKVVLLGAGGLFMLTVANNIFILVSLLFRIKYKNTFNFSGRSSAIIILIFTFAIILKGWVL